MREATAREVTKQRDHQDDHHGAGRHDGEQPDKSIWSLNQPTRGAEHGCDASDDIGDRQLDLFVEAGDCWRHGRRDKWNQDAARHHEDGAERPQSPRVDAMGKDPAHLLERLVAMHRSPDRRQRDRGERENDGGAAGEEKEGCMPAVLAGQHQPERNAEDRRHGKGGHDYAHRTSAAGRRNDVAHHGQNHRAGESAKRARGKSGAEKCAMRRRQGAGQGGEAKSGIQHDENASGRTDTSTNPPANPATAAASP